MYGAIRSTLIGYGVAAFTFLLARSGDGADTSAFGLSPMRLITLGLIVQVTLIGARRLLERRDPAVARTAMDMVELLADGVTVLLFAVATLGTVLHTAAAV